MRSGVLSPVESGKFIADNAKHVKIIEEGLNKLTDEIIKSIKDGRLEMPETEGDAVHPPKDHPRAADWVFVIDSLNFCFWSYGDSVKWTVNGYTGYYALEAAMMRAVKEGIDILNPEYYSKITEEQLRHIMRGDNVAEIPLLKQRLKILHDVGKTLIEKYDGSFENCIKIANKSAQKLIELVIEEFPCYDDVAEYKGKTVALFKRVQILVSDLQYFFGKDGLGAFVDIDSLTMFADYRVPQVIMYFGGLAYSDDLMEKLQNDVLLPAGSEEEVEIRGCSIHAVELLKRKVLDKLKDAPTSLERPNSAAIDYYLWCYRRKYALELETVPFHKTLGIFY